MSVEPWPTALPQRITYGSSTELDKKGNKAIVDFEYGPARNRRRFTFSPSLIEISMFFKDNEIEIFNSFYIQTLKQGTRFFYLDIPVGGQLVTHRCRFNEETLKVTNVTYNHWTIKTKVEIWQRFTYAEGALWLLGEYGAVFVEDELANPLHEIVEVTWPTITENL